MGTPSGDEAGAAPLVRFDRHNCMQGKVRRRKEKISFSWQPVLRLGSRESLAALRAKLLSRRRDDTFSLTPKQGQSSAEGTEASAELQAVTPTSSSALPSIHPAADPSSASFPANPVSSHRRRRGDAAYTSVSSSHSSSSASPSSVKSVGQPGCAPSRFYSPPWWAKAPDVVRCRFSPSGNFLAACTSLGSLRVYEVETGTLICEYANAHVKGINDIAWHPSSAYIFTASSDASASLFPLHFRPRDRAPFLSSPSALATFRVVPDAPASVSPVSLAGGKDKKGHMTAAASVSVPSSAQDAPPRGSVLNAGSLPAPVTSVAVPQDGSASGCLYTGGYDEILRLWDLRLPVQPLRQVKAHDCPITSLDFAPSSPLLLPPYASPRAGEFPCLDAISACPGIVASAGLDGLVRLWEASSLRLLRTLKGGSSGAASLGEKSEKEGEGGSSGSRRGIACTHAVWSRSGKFLLCAYEGGQGGRILRLSRVVNRGANGGAKRRGDSRSTRRRAEKKARKESETKETNATAQRETEETPTRGDASDLSEEEEEEEEEAWWGTAVTMPLDMPVAGTPQWEREQEEAQRATAEAFHRFSFLPDDGSFAPPSSSPRAHAGCCPSSHAFAETSPGLCTGSAGGLSENGVQARLAFAPFCTPRRWFSPFGSIWRDRALLPCGDGRVWVFKAMRGSLVEKLAAPVDFACACRGRGGRPCAGGSVCSSVDAHPDWSLGVIATSWTEPDGGIVVWMWTGEEEEDEEEEEERD
ncbi:conserved hypothetical protein [Neospora caninum Liverpool]|uniref:WD domain, G-beta repeat-containing protein n=1 Tax=Neospora caninum (strain Liverpool) TaxID=572307 RepID=F0V961_NEOCL|nr:conserved hypothetical protein [Neospora caninum Liverpool]CBZ50286.1 conserved hypothetical protein [Neospora caninum Liverpool]CEL64891.1 TPA: WD domain, G-beta repeat-containing protein [Neospora caninum Liverpool]|eukprot:XP_003880320.1 conserved hypothetical protein [Neospora caninum Liverpool]